MPKLEPVSGHPNLYLRPSNGKYYTRVYNSVLGRTAVKSLKTKILKQAIRVLARESMQLYLQSAQTVIIDDVVEQVSEHYKTTSKATRQSFELSWKNLSTFYAGCPIEDVGRLWDEYKAFSRRLNPRRKLKHDRAALIFITRRAFRQGLIPALPDFPIEARDKTPQRGRRLERTEIAKLYRAANKNKDWELKIDLYRTGMRSGEVSKLSYRDIDMTTGIINIRSETTKTRQSRMFMIPAKTVRKIQKRRSKGISEFIFPNALRPEEHESKTDKTWQKLKQRSGVIVKRHWFRHTAASAALEAGCHAETIKKTFGMSERVLRDVYYHPSKEEMLKAAEGAQGRKFGTNPDK